MKKVLALILALVLVLSLAACRGSSDSGEEKKDDTNPTEAMTEATVLDSIYKIGDTFVTENREFTLDRIVFHNLLRNVFDRDYLLPVYPDDREYNYINKDNNPLKADSSHIMLMIEFRQKNLSKTTISPVDDYNLRIEYSDGYIFTTDDCAMLYEDGVSGLIDMEPLSAEISCRAAFKLPLEIEKNTKEPLFLIVSIDGANYKYDLRTK